MCTIFTCSHNLNCNSMSFFRISTLSTFASARFACFASCVCFESSANLQQHK